jgi:hypothetical protein
MTATYISRLTTKTSDVYPTIEAWIAAHGDAGTKRPLLIGAKLELEAGGKSVMRTLEFPSEADFRTTQAEINAENAAAGKTEADRPYTVEKLSAPGL